MQKKKKKILKRILLLLFLCFLIINFCLDLICDKLMKDDHYKYTVAVFTDFKDFRDNQIKEAYRFTWERSFHPPVLITVCAEDDRATLHMQMATAPVHVPEYEPGVYLVDKEIPLTKEHLAGLRGVVYNNQFWKKIIPNYIKDHFEIGLDGAVWIVEVKQGGKYHLGERWSPKNGRIRNIGMHLIELSQYEFDPNEIY